LEDVAFELDPKGTGNPVDADATFVDASLAFLTKRILEVAVLYVKCCWYVERRSSPESGLTAQALAAAAKTYINDHLLTVLQLEDRANSTESRLTLQVWMQRRKSCCFLHVLFFRRAGVVVQHPTNT
jgi:Gamma tubulin complex component N-terminal